MADALVWPRIHGHTAALTDGQATWARGVRCTTRSASKARAKRSSTGRLGTVPPASRCCRQRRHHDRHVCTQSPPGFGFPKLQSHVYAVVG